VAGRFGVPGRLFSAFLLLMFIVLLLPFDWILTAAEFSKKYQQNRIRLIPFYPGYRTWSEWAYRELEVIWFLPAGLLLGSGHGTKWQKPDRWLTILLLGLGLATLLELLQLLVFSLTCNLTQVLSVTLVFMAGWWLGYSLNLILMQGLHRKFLRLDRRPSWLSQAAVILLFVWSGFLILLKWQPLTFQTTQTAQRWAQLSLAPFADFYLQPRLHWFQDVFWQTVGFVPVGAMFALKGPVRRRMWLGILFAFCLAGVIEFGQLYVSSGRPSVSEVVLAMFGSWLGFKFCDQLMSAIADHFVQLHRAVEQTEDEVKTKTETS
jgi:glycopeptide antibiotics resistance protein